MAPLDTPGAAAHWLALRDASVRVNAQDRAKAREAWRAAAEAYARSTQPAAMHGGNGDAATPSGPVRMRDVQPG